jgi:hypothetical protein
MASTCSCSAVFHALAVIGRDSELLVICPGPTQKLSAEKEDE